jgi:two-component system, sensor histidine kinase LadS
MVLGNSGHEDAAAIAERVRRGVETLRLPHEKSQLGIVTVSVGIAHALTIETNAQALVRETDMPYVKPSVLAAIRCG